MNKKYKNRKPAQLQFFLKICATPGLEIIWQELKVSNSYLMQTKLPEGTFKVFFNNDVNFKIVRKTKLNFLK